MVEQTWVEGTGVQQRVMCQETNVRVIPKGTLDVESTFLFFFFFAFQSKSMYFY